MALDILVTVSVPLLTGLAYGLYVVFRHRLKIYRLRQQGLPMPEGWTWLTGNLLSLQKLTARLPADVNVMMHSRNLLAEFQDTELILVDTWPVFGPLYFTSNPDVATQVSTGYNLPKAPSMGVGMKPITGGPNLISMNGDEWKAWRAVFNPGFSAKNMLDLVPLITDSVEVFCDILREKAGSGIVHLDELTMRLTMDVILKSTLGADLDYQHRDNDIATSLLHITAWHSFWDPRITWNPITPFIQTYYGRVMDRCIHRHLHQRFHEMVQTDAVSSELSSKSVVTLALRAYLEAHNKDPSGAPTLDDEFLRYATYQIRLFLFAGNDTTSSSIVYVYHNLSRHPDALARVRQEHDRVFGTSTAAAAQLLRENPALLNQCPYSLAVIKETLRLFPPAATWRQGLADAFVRDRSGRAWPTEGMGVCLNHAAIHINPRLWPRAREFVPDRWLVDPGHELYPDPAAYRPFEQGPRNCIGQTLVYNEMRIVLILTARALDIAPAYDEWDALQAERRGVVARWLHKEGIKTVDGNRAYQTEKVGTHPADGYPCRVTLAGAQAGGSGITQT